MENDLVLTPGGYRSKSMVHLIEPGHIIDGMGDRFRKVDARGNLVADLGPRIVRPGKSPLMPRNVCFGRQARAERRRSIANATGAVPALGTGWIIFASWINNTGNPVTEFRTTWRVPPAPASGQGQIFLFNGIQNSSMIYQPVLQWGSSRAGGGPYWAVASWYADGQDGPAFHSTLIPVHPGDELVGVMTLTGQTNTPAGMRFSYNCAFKGFALTGLPIQNVEELTWCVETLEAYNMARCSDYPAALATQMREINIRTGATSPVTIGWTPIDSVTDVGQYAVVVDDFATDGEVDLFYHAWLAPFAATAWSADRLDVFGLGENHGMVHKWWDGNAWGPSLTGWDSLGGAFR